MDQSDREKLFWNNYLAVLAEHSIKPELFSWYTRHCEAFIRKYKETRLKQHTSKSVNTYFDQLVNHSNRPAWQKKQHIDAIAYLFKSIHAPWYLNVDWDYWKSSCVDLPKNHVTLYAEKVFTDTNKNRARASGPEADSQLVKDEIDKMKTAVRRKK